MEESSNKNILLNNGFSQKLGWYRHNRLIAGVNMENVWKNTHSLERKNLVKVGRRYTLQRLSFGRQWMENLV